MTARPAHIRRLDQTFFRMKYAAEAADILMPAHAPEGRFHYGGQRALYLSETPRGTFVASKRYMQPGDPARAIFALHVVAENIVDLRDDAACHALEIDVTHRAAEWQNDRAKGLAARSWAISDRVRTLGLDGMLYASRSMPGLCHLTLFQWNLPGHAQVAQVGPPFAPNFD